MFAILLLSAALAAPPPPTNDLVAHEWGTFTTFSGSSGAPVSFSSGGGVVGDGSLPDWVLGYTATADGKLAAHEAMRLKFAARGLVRMETPVIYFYTARPISIDVHVRFNTARGLMTEFFPPPTLSGQRADDEASFNRAAASLDWSRLSVWPANSPEAMKAKVPDAGNSHYAEARATDAAIVTTTVDGKIYEEKFLFYRGVADFELPITFRALGNDAFEILNSGKAPLAAAYLLELRSGKLRFSMVAVPVGATRANLPKDAADAAALRAALEQSLTAAGLYPKESAAMLATWKAHWLGEDGTRLLYLVPRPVVDRVLPLHINPAPVSTERVFVARAELMTPETERTIAGLLAQAEAAPEQDRPPILAKVRALAGRFTGPACELIRSSPAPKTADAGR